MANPLNNLSHNDRESIDKAKKNNKNKGEVLEVPSVASASEMTGLMHKPPETAGELEAYNDLIGMPVLKKKNKKRDNK